MSQSELDLLPTGDVKTSRKSPGSQNEDRFTFYEFFAGGGMARLGLGPRWQCLFANDWSSEKMAAYRANFDSEEPVVCGDVASLAASDLPGRADLVWGSFPCQDLSLAGPGHGLHGSRSGAFWPFWNLILSLREVGRQPPVVVLENVVGALSSHGGKDFATIIRTLVQADYQVGAMVMDAADLLPHSRPRLFIVAVERRVAIPESVRSGLPHHHWHPPSLRTAALNLGGQEIDNWVWWRLPVPPPRVPLIEEVIETALPDEQWDSSAATARLLELMSPLHLRKIEAAKESGKLRVGFAYRRTRLVDGVKRQFVEVRFDGVAGCLRTPAGGSSRQIVFVVDGPSVRSRLLSAREAARLMGIPDDYQLPDSYNEAYTLAGDGVAVPVVSWLEQHLLRELAQAARATAVSRKGAGNLAVG